LTLGTTGVAGSPSVPFASGTRRKVGQPAETALGVVSAAAQQRSASTAFRMRHDGAATSEFRGIGYGRSVNSRPDPVPGWPCGLPPPRRHPPAKRGPPVPVEGFALHRAPSSPRPQRPSPTTRLRFPPSEARRVSGPPGRGSRLHTACIIFFADAATGQDPAAAQR
jgi:hypothetical protein